MKKIVPLRRGMVAAGGALVGLGAWQGAAIASAPAETSTKSIHFDNDSCGTTEQGSKIGFVRFKRENNRMTLRVTMKHAIPHHGYTIELYNGDTCNLITSSVGFLFTDSQGNGEALFNGIDVSGYDFLF